MSTRLTSWLIFLVLIWATLSPANSAELKSKYVKLGYFNLAQVKASSAAGTSAEALRASAESQLRQDVEGGNRKLQDAQKQHLAKAEIEKMAQQMQAEINAKQQALIQLVQAQQTEENTKIASAVGEIARENGLDVIFDGAAVFTGGQVAVDNGVDITKVLIARLNRTDEKAPADYRQSAKAVAVKFAYFNLAVVKAVHKESLDADAYRSECENVLRKEVEDGNKQLSDMMTAGTDKAGLEKCAKELQTKINEKQQELIAKVSARTKIATTQVSQAVNTAARGSGADLVVDGAGVFFGGNVLIASGRDITEPIKDKLGLRQTARATDSEPASLPAATATASAAQASSMQALPGSSVTARSTSYAPQAARTEDASEDINRPIKDKWALVIGISQFSHPEYNLKYAAKDAADFKEFLVKECNFAEDHVKLLVNTEATRQSIMSAFGDTWLPRIAMPGDLVVVYMSTHGTPSTRDAGQKNYIVAYDTDRDELFGTGVNMNDLCSQIKERVNTDRVLLVMDTCYSGAAAAGARGLERAANFDPEAIALGSGHLVISSSSPNEQSWESADYPNGIFTHNLIKSLRKQNKSIDVLNAFEDARKNIEWEVQSNFGAKQTPVLGGKWQGINLILSAPAAQPRALPPSLREPGQTRALPGSGHPATHPASSKPVPARGH